MLEDSQVVPIQTVLMDHANTFHLKLNASGVMPIIFAQASNVCASYIGGALGDSDTRTMVTS